MPNTVEFNRYSERQHSVCNCLITDVFNLESAVELVERVVANGVIGVGKKFVVTLLVMRTFFLKSGASVDAAISRGLTAESRFNNGFGGIAPLSYRGPSS